MRRHLAILLSALLVAVPAYADFMSGGGKPGTTTGSGTTGNLTSWASSSTLTDYAGSSACSAGSFVTALSAAGATTCTAASGTISGLTTGLIPQAASATSLSDSSSYRIAVTNDTVTGTTANKLVKLTSTGRAIITSTSETSGVLGVCVSGCGTTGSAIIALIGSATCSFTNATTAGNYATVSTSVAGDCQDTGSTTFPAAGTQVLGVITETGVAGNRTTFLATPDVASAASGGGGGGSKNPAGSAGDVQYRATNNNFDAEADFNYVEGSSSALTIGSAAPQVVIRGDALAASEYQLFVDGGTLPASTNQAFRVVATNASGGNGVIINITGAGSAASDQFGTQVNLLAGYTGANRNAALFGSNQSLGTGNNLQLGTNSDVAGNSGVYFGATGAGSGLHIGGTFLSGNSTGNNVGVYGRANGGGGGTAGTMIGVLGNADDSTEGTGLINVGGAFGIGAGGTPAVNTSVALLADNGAVAAPIFNAYDNGTLTFSIADGGAVSTTTTFKSTAANDLGWTVQNAANQACNTTCTTGACVTGIDTITTAFLACTDATADSCLCAA